MIGAAVLIGMGAIGYGSSESSGGAWMIAAGGFVAFLSVMFLTLVPLILKIESTITRQFGTLRDLHDSMAQQIAALDLIVENTGISDAAKSLAHREQELDMLRRVIREDQGKDHWERALSLIDEMEVRFGCKEEADQFREQLDAARSGAMENRLREAIEMIEGHFQVYAWTRARHEIDRLLNLLPDNARVLALHDRMQSLKDNHKQTLLASWQEAVRRNDTDQAIDILRELDQYLSVAEAEALRSSARDVFKDKLLQLGVQFRFAVNEKRWQDALGTGLELIREFPNARMASEVREALDTLRSRAQADADGGVSGATPQITRT